MRRCELYCLFVLMGCFSCFYAHGQLKQAGKVQLNQKKQLPTYESDLISILDFPNIGREAFYYNKREIKELRKLHNKQNWEAMLPLLKHYVSKFGVENFYKSNDLLWFLARISLMEGDTTGARTMYKLVLKHYRQGGNLEQIMDEFGDLQQQKRSDFVPLDYYYELVEYRKAVDTLRPPQGVLLNMGMNVNSEHPDYGPTLHADGNVMLFTSERNTTTRNMEKQANEDLFVTEKKKEYWTRAKPLNGINTAYNEGSACLSPDRQHLFFVRCNSPRSYGNCDLFMATLQADSTWGDVKNLGEQVNSKAWDSHPALSPNGDTLYFASDRLGGFGMSDIYFTYPDEQGNWVPPINAGPIVNTRRNEVSPFPHPEYPILYFSSDGQLLNFGEFDIYKSYWQATHWSEPLNIGPLVNGEGSEFYFTMDRNAETLFYSRSEEKERENLDLFSFPLPMEAQPLATTKLKGRLINQETGEPFDKGIVSIIDVDNGVEVAPRFLKKDGSFQFQLIDQNNYIIVIQGEDFFRLEDLFFLDGDTSMIKKTDPVSRRLEFTTMNFDNGKAELRPEMYADLDKLIDFLLDHPDYKLTIEGHTDSDGDRNFNLKLSQNRADAIKNYIIEFGKISTKRVKAIGYGSTRPIRIERTEADKKINRRVEFNLYKEGGQR